MQKNKGQATGLPKLLKIDLVAVTHIEQARNVGHGHRVRGNGCNHLVHSRDASRIRAADARHSGTNGDVQHKLMKIMRCESIICRCCKSTQAPILGGVLTDVLPVR